MSDQNYSNPYTEWRVQNPETSFTPEQNRKINLWAAVSYTMLDAFNQLEYEIEPWLNGTRQVEPDIVKYISRYGFIVEVTRNWTELPIKIPSDEIENWKKANVPVATIEQLEDWRAGVAGGVARMLQLDLPLVVRTIKKQLPKRYEDLTKLSQQPIHYFNPTQWNDDDVGEEYWFYEEIDLGVIFEKYEELHCFKQGIEALRMIMITEKAPKFGVPSREFYDALVSVDSRALMEVLHPAELKMKEILKLWSTTIMELDGKPYYRERRDAPDTFWWRHWKSGQKKQEK